MKPTYVQNLDDLHSKDAPAVGGKGANLGELCQMGTQVPPGFVLLTAAFDEVITAARIEPLWKKLHDCKADDIATITTLSASLTEAVRNAPVPASIKQSIDKAFHALGVREVAVRSSAIDEDGAEAAWAGQLESFLYVKEEGLLTAIQQCWASLFSVRALTYRLRQGAPVAAPHMAVVVQRMLSAKVAGVAFSVDPISQNKDQVVIEAVFGDCEALVSGAITPDSYTFQKSTHKVIEVAPSPQETMLQRGKTVPTSQPNQQKLSSKLITELGELCQKIEAHFGSPQDIEWVHDGKRFFVVQARPITTLS